MSAASPFNTASHRRWIDIRIRVGRWRLRLRPRLMTWLIASFLLSPFAYLLSLGPIYALANVTGLFEGNSQLTLLLGVYTMPAGILCQIAPPFEKVLMAYLSLWVPM